jgi:hypothetical protein
MSKKLDSFLAENGVIKTAAAAPATPAPKGAAPAKTAAPGAAKPAAAPAKTAAPAAPAKTEPQAKTAAELFLAKEGLTDDQKFLGSKGIFIEDAKVAHALIQNEVRAQQQAKQAELAKFADEQRAVGALIWHGMVKESTAVKLAMREIGVQEAAAVVQYIPGVELADVIKRAEELQAASGGPMLLGDEPGRAARTSDSHTLSTADANDTTKGFQPAEPPRPATAGGPDLVRMTSGPWNLPGNPGLNLGQAVNTMGNSPK